MSFNCHSKMFHLVLKADLNLFSIYACRVYIQICRQFVLQAKEIFQFYLIVCFLCVMLFSIKYIIKTSRLFVKQIKGVKGQRIYITKYSKMFNPIFQTNNCQGLFVMQNHIYFFLSIFFSLKDSIFYYLFNLFSFTNARL